MCVCMCVCMLMFMCVYVSLCVCVQCVFLPRGMALRGKGVPWVQIMENEFEYLADRGDHGGRLAEKFWKKYCS